jgi:hypothetical protein
MGKDNKKKALEVVAEKAGIGGTSWRFLRGAWQLAGGLATAG